MTFDELLDYALDQQCSDIHITVGTHLAVRRFGTLQIINPEPSMEEARAIINELMTPEQIALADSGKEQFVSVLTYIIREVILQPV